MNTKSNGRTASRGASCCAHLQDPPQVAMRIESSHRQSFWNRAWNTVPVNTGYYTPIPHSGFPEGEPSPMASPPPISYQNAASAHRPAAAGVATRHPSLALLHLSSWTGAVPLGSPVSWRAGGVLNRVAAPLFSLLWDRNIPGAWICSLDRGQ